VAKKTCDAAELLKNETAAAATKAKTVAKEKRAAAEAKKDALLTGITDVKKKKLASIAAAAAIRGEKVLVLKVAAVVAADASAACADVCIKMQVKDCAADVVCDATVKNRRRGILAGNVYDVSVTPDPTVVDAAAAETNLKSAAVPGSVSQVKFDPIQVLGTVVADTTTVAAFQADAAAAVKADKDAAAAEAAAAAATVALTDAEREVGTAEKALAPYVTQASEGGSLRSSASFLFLFGSVAWAALVL
jgi:hypothetical protein